MNLKTVLALLSFYMGLVNLVNPHDNELVIYELATSKDMNFMYFINLEDEAAFFYIQVFT